MPELDTPEGKIRADVWTPPQDEGVETQMDHPLRAICTAWLEKIRLAMEFKKKRFQEDADEAMQFFNGPHDFMYYPKYATSSRGFVLGSEEDIPDPTFRMTCNRVAEMVQLFGPVLYHRNPIRQVNPRKLPSPPPGVFGDPNNPQVQQQYQMIMQQLQQSQVRDNSRAELLQHYLNYTPSELDLQAESRSAIDEAIIKGMGVLWTEIYYPKGTGIRLVGSFYDTVDNLFIDPDMESRKDAKWIARRRVRPVWEVERQYSLKPGTLRGNVESYNAQAASQTEEDADYQRKRGLSNDLLIYYEVFSKMGLGARLSGSPTNKSQLETLDAFGDFCYLVLANDVPFPLNLPSDLLKKPDSDQEILNALEWPTPFWADDEWPYTAIVFHEIPRMVWPMSHLKPALGEMKFLNWAYSFIASKIRTTCRDFIAVQKRASEELKSAIGGGYDLTIIELEHQYKTVNEAVGFLQHPSWNGDIWKVIQAVEHNFEKRVGLTELVYGQTAVQQRSAAEANVKSNQMQVRPDDMASKVEQAMTIVSRKEAMAARWHLKPPDVLPIMGPIGAQLWAQMVMSADLYEVVHQLDYRIEAGSTRKPNKERDAANMNQAMQTLFSPLMGHAQQTGDFNPVNKLITDWAKSIDLDPEGYTMKPPPPPPPPVPQVETTVELDAMGRPMVTVQKTKATVPPLPQPQPGQPPPPMPPPEVLRPPLTLPPPPPQQPSPQQPAVPAQPGQPQGNVEHIQFHHDANGRIVGATRRKIT